MSTSARVSVSLSIRDSIATVLLDQKSSHNALRLRTWLAIPGLIAAADEDPSVGVIILRGAHGNFGSGNDLVELRALHGNPAAAKKFASAAADATRAVERALKPVIVAIEGLCYGGSVALALAGDLRIAAENATFAITPAKIGALYLQSDLDRLVAAIGLGQSKRLMYSAQPISAQHAQRIGLVDDVIPANHFDSDLKGLTDAILRGSPSTLRKTKQMLGLVAYASIPAESDDSLNAFVEATQGRDFVEGVDAFLGKRPPQFR